MEAQGGSPALFLSPRQGGEGRVSAEGMPPPPLRPLKAPRGPLGPPRPPHLRTLERLHRGLVTLPGLPSSAAGRERVQVEQTWPSIGHGSVTLPGDVEERRGPQNRVASELPERAGA